MTTASHEPIEILTVAKALTKQEMRRNPLVEWVVAAVRFVQARRTVVMTASAAMVLAAGASSGYWWYQGHREAEASRALSQAHAALRGGQPGGPGNPDEATRRFREVAQRYGGTRSAEEALIRLGNIQFDAGRIEDAVGSFDEYLTSYARGRFRVMAGLGKAYAQEVIGDFQGAARTLSQLLEGDRDDPLSGEAYMSLARLYERLKKPDEAMRAYGQVVERFSQTSWAQSALQRMGALRAQ